LDDIGVEGMRRACRKREKETGSTERCWHFAYLFHHLPSRLRKKSKEEDSSVEEKRKSLLFLYISPSKKKIKRWWSVGET